MDGANILVAGAAIDAVTAAVIVFAVKKVVSSSIEGMRNHCNTVSEAIKKTDEDQWSAINTHGHKGLNGDDAKVTR